MDVELHTADEDLVQKDTVLEPQVMSFETWVVIKVLYMISGPHLVPLCERTRTYARARNNSK